MTTRHITELLKGLAEVRSGLNQTASHKAWLLQAESKELQDLCIMLGCCGEATLPASASSLNFEHASVGWPPRTVRYERTVLLASRRATELMLRSVSVASDLVEERLPLVLVPGNDGGRSMPARQLNPTNVLIAEVLAAAGDANGLPSCSYCRHAGLVEGDHQCDACNGVCLRLAPDGEWTILDCERITQELEDQLREAITLVMRTLNDLNRSNESFTRSLTLRGILRALNEPSQLGLLDEVTQELTGLALANELLMCTLGVFMNDLTEVVRNVRAVFLELPELCEEVYQPRLAPLLLLIHGRLIGAFNTSRDESTHAHDIYREQGQLSNVVSLMVSTHAGNGVTSDSVAMTDPLSSAAVLVDTLLAGRFTSPRLSFQLQLPCFESLQPRISAVSMYAWDRRCSEHMIACLPCCMKRPWSRQNLLALEHHPVITVRGPWQVHPSSGRMSDDAWNLLRYLTDDLRSLKDASDMDGFIEFLFYWRFVPAALHDLLIEAAEPWMQAACDVELHGLEWASGLSDGWPLKGMRVGYFGSDGAALCLYDERLLIDRGDLQGWSQPSPPLGGPPFKRVTGEIEWPLGGSESLGDYWYQCRERSTCAPRGYVTCCDPRRQLTKSTRRRSAYPSISIRFVLEDSTAEAVTKIQRAWRYRRQTKGAGYARYIRRVGGGGGSVGDSSVPSSDSTPPANLSEQAPSAAEAGVTAACAGEAGAAALAGAGAPAGEPPATLASACCASAPAGAAAPAGELPATLASACCASGGTLPEPTRPMRTASRSSSSRRRAAPAGDDRLWVAGDFGRALESKLLAGATPFATPAPLASSRKEHPGRAQGSMPAPPIGLDAVPRVPSTGDELQPVGILRSPSAVKPAMSPSRSGDLRPVDPSDLGLPSAFASAIAMRNRCSISASIQPVAAKGLTPVGASLPHTPTGSRSAADRPGGQPGSGAWSAADRPGGQPGSGASEQPGSGGGHAHTHGGDYADEEDEADDPDDEDDDDPEDGGGPYRGRSGGWLPPQRTSRDELGANEWPIMIIFAICEAVPAYDAGCHVSIAVAPSFRAWAERGMHTRLTHDSLDDDEVNFDGLSSILGALHVETRLVRNRTHNQVKEGLRREVRARHNALLEGQLKVHVHTSEVLTFDPRLPIIIVRSTFECPRDEPVERSNFAWSAALRELGLSTHVPCSVRLLMQVLHTIGVVSPADQYLINTLIHLLTAPPVASELLTGTPFRGANYERSHGSYPSSSRGGTSAHSLDKAPALQLVRNVIPEARGTLGSWVYSIVQLTNAGVHHELPRFLIGLQSPVHAFVAAVRERLKSCKLVGFSPHDATRLDSPEATATFNELSYRFNGQHLPQVSNHESLNEKTIGSLTTMMQDVLRHVRAYLCDITPEALEYKELREMLNYAPHDEMDGRERLAAINTYIVGWRDVWGAKKFNELVQTKGDQLFEMIMNNLFMPEQERIIHLADMYVKEVIRKEEPHSRVLTKLRGVSAAAGAFRVAYVDQHDDLRVLIECGYFWKVWSSIGSRVRRLSSGVARPSGMRVITSGAYQGRTELDVLQDVGYEPGTPEASMLLAVSSRGSAELVRQFHSAPSKTSIGGVDTLRDEAPVGPAAAPQGSYGPELREGMQHITKTLDAMEARLNAMEKNTHEYVDVLRTAAAAANLGAHERLRASGDHLPTAQATQHLDALAPTVGRQMPVQPRAGVSAADQSHSPLVPALNRSANFRNDPNNTFGTSTPDTGGRAPPFALRSPRSDRQRERGPGFSLQFQNFEPVGWEEIDLEQRENLAKYCDIADDATYQDKGRRAPCAWCGGPHWLVHCPGGAWACTAKCRTKVGDAVAEATRLKYDAKRAALQQRQLVVAAVHGDQSDLLQQADRSEYVPISRLAAVVGSDMERLCALCNCTVDDDVEVLFAGATDSMADSYMFRASAEARER